MARRQLLALGLGRRAIDHRVATRRLVVIHRGVYAVGHGRLTRRGRWMAAVLACGPGAVLSHRDAAALHGIRPDHRRKIDVTVTKWRKGPDVVAIHTSRIDDDERTIIDGIPVTTAFRTLLDLTQVLDDRELQQAYDETERLRIAEPLSLTSLCERHENRPGTKRLAKLQPDARVTRSEFERGFLAYLDREVLPRPQTNVIVEGTPSTASGGSRAWSWSSTATSSTTRAAHSKRIADGTSSSPRQGSPPCASRGAA